MSVMYTLGPAYRNAGPPPSTMIYLIVFLGIAFGLGALLWWGLSGPANERPNARGQDVAIYGTDARALIDEALHELAGRGRGHEGP